MASCQTSVALKRSAFGDRRKQFRQPLLNHRGQALIDHRDLAGIRVNTNDMVTQLGKTCPGNGPDITKAKH